RGAKRKDPGGHVEVVDATPSAGFLAYGAFEVNGVDPGHSRAAGQKVDAIPLRRPTDPGRMSRAHVVDHAVVHGQVEVGGEAPRATAGQRDDPEALEQADVEPVG